MYLLVTHLELGLKIAWLADPKSLSILKKQHYLISITFNSRSLINKCISKTASYMECMVYDMLLKHLGCRIDILTIQGYC